MDETIKELNKLGFRKMNGWYDSDTIDGFRLKFNKQTVTVDDEECGVAVFYLSPKYLGKDGIRRILNMYGFCP